MMSCMMSGIIPQASQGSHCVYMQFLECHLLLLCRQDYIHAHACTCMGVCIHLCTYMYMQIRIECKLWNKCSALYSVNVNLSVNVHVIVCKIHKQLACQLGCNHHRKLEKLHTTSVQCFSEEVSDTTNNRTKKEHECLLPFKRVQYRYSYFN